MKKIQPRHWLKAIFALLMVILVPLSLTGVCSLFPLASFIFFVSIGIVGVVGYLIYSLASQYRDEEQ